MFRISIHLLAKTSLVALALSALAVPAHAEPLSQAVVSALNYHPSVEAALANREALAEESKEKWSEYWPQVSVATTGGRMYGDNSTSRGLTTTRGAAYSYLWEGNASVKQLFFDGFETFNRIDAAGDREQSANYNISDVRERVALRTVVAYMDVLRGRRTVEMLKEHRKKLDDYISRIEKMVKEGAADTAMSEQARDIRAQLDNTLSASEGQLRVAHATYMELTGHPPDDPMEKPADPATIPQDNAEAVKVAQKSHPALRAAGLTEAAFGHEAAAEKASIYPDFSGELSWLESDKKDEIGGEATDKRAVVHMNWNYSIGGAQQARARKMLYRQKESRAQRDDRARQIGREIETAYHDRTVAQEQMKIQQERVRINEGLLSAHRAQFEAAKVTILQILQTDNALFNAKLGLLNGEYRHLASGYAILASMGQLQDALNIRPAAADEN